MFLKVTLLRELLKAELARVGLNTRVHSHVIEQIVCPQKFFVSALESTHVDGVTFSRFVDLAPSTVIKVLQELEVNVVLRVEHVIFVFSAALLAGTRVPTASVALMRMVAEALER